MSADVADIKMLAKGEPIVGVVPVSSFMDEYDKAFADYNNDELAKVVESRMREGRALTATEVRYVRETNTIKYLDANGEHHEGLQCLMLRNVQFKESRVGICGGGFADYSGFMSGDIVADVVGFLRAGAPVQRGRYSKSYGWNVTRANRAIVEGKDVYFD